MSILVNKIIITDFNKSYKINRKILKYQIKCLYILLFRLVIPLYSNPIRLNVDVIPQNNRIRKVTDKNLQSSIGRWQNQLPCFRMRYYHCLYCTLTTE